MTGSYQRRWAERQFENLWEKTVSVQAGKTEEIWYFFLVNTTLCRDIELK